jgi:hypothetical protein
MVLAPVPSSCPRRFCAVQHESRKMGGMTRYSWVPAILRCTIDAAELPNELRATAHEITAHEITAHEITAHEITAHEITAHEITAHGSRANERRANERRANERRANERRANERRANERRANEQRLTAHEYFSVGHSAFARLRRLTAHVVRLTRCFSWLTGGGAGLDSLWPLEGVNKKRRRVFRLRRVKKRPAQWRAGVSEASGIKPVSIRAVFRNA